MTWSTAFVPYGSGRKAPVGGLADGGLLERLLRYKRQVAKRYRVIEPGQMERLLPQGTLWLSPKLDGELWFLVRRGGDLALCAHNGRVLHGIPLLAALAARLAPGGDFLVAGELVAPLAAQGRPRSHHVALAFGDGALADRFAFHPFDLVEDGGERVVDRPYGERLARLQALFGGADGTVATVTGDSAQAQALYREWVAAGHHEGLVARSEQNLTFKIKPVLTIDAVVIAYGERIVGDLRQLRELTVGLVRDDGTWQVLGTVGSGFSEDDRVAWHRRLAGLAAPSSFRMANSEGTLSRFVRPELVVELRASDLLVSDAEDLPIRRMALAHGADGWRPLGEQATAVMLHPAFLRERTDKQPTAVDCGLAQLTSRVQLEDDATAAAPAGGTTARIAARGVWTKDAKGQVAVRKYVLVGRPPARDHAAFTLFCTDYSPGRAEPLQTALRTAATRAAADLQIAAWIAENVKKGWNPADGGETTGTAPDAAGAAAAPAEATGPAPRKRAAKKPAE